MKKIFSQIGAMSSDKQFRTEHETWWPQETVTEEKFQSSLNELTKVNFKIALSLLIQHHHEFYPHLWIST